ncbi:hypothetical protein HNR60_003296 [Rhodopseudomonas rhenobacensis]|uniref:Uncharacterized protein n=1 Tax=Rhodopseudomonas rhenobacensis TaxID=87461 RepID=A0A7W8DZN4_9BRAD|nr:hypothetical protein [Rhodopseudomonas rhenobacensis]MBB5048529.1 hypothetical protein [Rhodopseudomonas rhenobacensis]
MLRLLLSIAAIVLATNGAAFGLSMKLQTDPQQGLAYVSLWGHIDEGDAQKFRRLVTPALRAGLVLYRVTISSPGGAVDDAVDIGEQIYVLRAQVRSPTLPQGGSAPICGFTQVSRDIVQPGAGADTTDPDGDECTCASACFFIWVSGFTRDGNTIGIHRFTYVDARGVPYSVSQTNSQYLRDQRKLSEFLWRKGVAPFIINRMFATDPDDMYFLNSSEIALLQRTPGVTDYVKARCSEPGYPPRYARSSSGFNDTAGQFCRRNSLLEFMRVGVARYLNG